jgi:hypothetical protein
MRIKPKFICPAIFIFVVFFNFAVYSQTYLDAIGVNLFRETTTNLNGSGIRVAQPEAYDPYTPPGTNTWEVNPSTVNQPTNLFTYTSSSGVANSFTNSVGFQSDHADSVAYYFYGIDGQEATNVAHVDSYDANYFVQVSEVPVELTTNYTTTLPSTNLDDAVVNQSFTFGEQPTNLQNSVDSAYDDYAAHYNTLFVTGVGNSGYVGTPGTCYNGIGVGAYDGNSSFGPTPDNGRCKPDIVAPASDTSWSTPMVAGVAALLVQAAIRGDGGGNTNAGADIRTIKALLLNGAVKPSDWINYPPEPLSTNYGAGILNAYNSYQQFGGGEHNYNISNSVPQGTAHPPVSSLAFIPSLNGWNFGSISSSSSGLFSTASDGVEHYFLNVTNAPNNVNFTLTSTLVWERQRSQTDINHLALFLYNCANSNLVACSTSLVDNVQHVFVPQLPKGRYDLQVWKPGGTYVSASESYALAWTITSTSMSITQSGSNINLSWPAFPAGFVLQVTTNLNSLVIWSTNNLPFSTYAGGQETISIAATTSAQFFQLAPP